MVVSVDEKPPQVLARKHPTHVDQRDGSVRYEHEYKRHGTQALLVALDIQTGEALVAFMASVASRYPDQQVYVVWDNLNTHYDGKDARWTEFNERHGGRFHFVYTPKHASWMNQVESWFSILQRRVIRHGDFNSASAQKKRVLGFISRWNRLERHPFRWTWRADRSHNSRPAA